MWKFEAISDHSLIADELGDLRALIRTLKAREAVLRRRILERRPNAPSDGLLPDSILANPRFCKTEFDAAKLLAHIRDDPRYHSAVFKAQLLPEAMCRDPQFCTGKYTDTVLARHHEAKAPQNRK